MVLLTTNNTNIGYNGLQNVLQAKSHIYTHTYIHTVGIRTCGYVCTSVCTYVYVHVYILYTAHETAICHNLHNSRVSRKLGYKHTICQNLAFTKRLLLLMFSWRNYKLECWSTKDLSSSFLCPVKLCIEELWQIALSWAIYMYI